MTTRRKPKRQSGQQTTVTARAKEALLVAPWKTNPQIARDLNCSVRMVSYARTQLTRQGLLTKSPYDRTTPDPPLVTEGAREILEEVSKIRDESGEPLTDEEKLKMLTGFARKAHGKGDSKQAIDAIRAHTALKEKTAEGSVLGPPPPLTEDEKVDRLSSLIEICGPSITSRAVQAAFTEGTNLTDFCTLIGRLAVTAPQPPEPPIAESSDEADAATTPPAETQGDER